MTVTDADSRQRRLVGGERVRRALRGDRTLMAVRSFPVEDIRIRSKAEGGDGRTVDAYAAVFNDPTEILDMDGHYMERNDPSAFNKSIAERRNQIFCVYNHAKTLSGTPSDVYSIPIGTPVDIRADSRGLFTSTRYNRSQAANDILEAIDAKSIRGMSYTGVFLRSDPELQSRFDEYGPDKDGRLPMVTRQEIALIEYGPTPIPAFDSAVILGVRSMMAKHLRVGPDPYIKKPEDVVECPNCGLCNEQDCIYCDQCGEGPLPLSCYPGGVRTPYEARGDENVQCPADAKWNLNDAVFCDQCGIALPGTAYNELGFNPDYIADTVTPGSNPAVSGGASAGYASVQKDFAQSSGRQPSPGPRDRAHPGTEDHVTTDQAARDGRASILGLDPTPTQPPSGPANSPQDQRQDAPGEGHHFPGGDTSVDAAPGHGPMSGGHTHPHGDFGWTGHGAHYHDHSNDNDHASHLHPGMRWDPDGDGDDDSTPQGDLDHSHWDEWSQQIADVPGKPVGGKKPPNPEPSFGPSKNLQGGVASTLYPPENNTAPGMGHLTASSATRVPDVDDRDRAAIGSAGVLGLDPAVPAPNSMDGHNPLSAMGAGINAGPLMTKSGHRGMIGIHVHDHDHGAFGGGYGNHAHEHSHDGDGEHNHNHDAFHTAQNGLHTHLHLAYDGLNGTHVHDHSHYGDGVHDHVHEPGQSMPSSGQQPMGSSSGRDPHAGDAHSRVSVDNSAWDGPAAMSRCLHSDNPASGFASICAGRRSGDPSQEATWALPHHKSPGAPPNANGVRNALARISQTQGLTNKAAAQRHLESHMSDIGGGDGNNGSSSSSGRQPAAGTAARAHDGAADWYGTGAADSSAEPHTHPVHDDSTRSSTTVGNDVDAGRRMTAAERTARRAEISGELELINRTHQGVDFPPYVQARWDQLVAEDQEHDKAIQAINRRASYLAERASTGAPGVTEGIDNTRTGYPDDSGYGGGYGSDALSGRYGGDSRDGGYSDGHHGPNNSRTAPGFVRRPAYEELFDLQAIRNRARNWDDMPNVMREAAFRAVEATRFPGLPVGMTSQRAQENIHRMLDNIDDPYGELPKRILVTGSPIYERAFGKMFKAQSTNGLTPEEHRSLLLGTDAAGGFAVPFQLDPTVILTYNGVINPLRQISRVEQITGKEWDGVTSTGVVVARAAESQEASDNSPALLQPTVRTTRVQGFVPFSVELDVSWGNMRNQITQMLADAKDIEEANSFLNGSGTAPQANGLVTFLTQNSFASTVSVLKTASTATIVISDLYSVENNAAPKFRATSSWLGSKTTYNFVRNLFVQQASAAGDPWVRPSSGTPAEFLNYPAYEASQMPGPGSPTSGSNFLIFGDFKQFLIVDRIGMGIELVPHLFGPTNHFPTGQRGLFAIWFNNCQTLAANAFRILQVR